MSAVHRRRIAALRREVSTLQAKAEGLAKQTGRRGESPETPTKARLIAKGLRSMRARLGLSTAELATLLGVSPRSIYNWEHWKASLRQSYIDAIAALRGIGKKDARKRLESSAASVRARGTVGCIDGGLHARMATTATWCTDGQDGSGGLRRSRQPDDARQQTDEDAPHSPQCASSATPKTWTGENSS